MKTKVGSGCHQTDVETAISDYQQQIEDYINNQNPDATVGDVLGTQKVIVQVWHRAENPLTFYTMLTFILGLGVFNIYRYIRTKRK